MIFVTEWKLSLRHYEVCIWLRLKDLSIFRRVCEAGDLNDERGHKCSSESFEGVLNKKAS